jgi:hypothetical protein
MNTTNKQMHRSNLHIMKNLIKKVWIRNGTPLHKSVKWAVQDQYSKLEREVEIRLVKWQGGYKCVDCGTTDTRFKSGLYEGNVNGKRMMVQYTGGYYHSIGKTLCPHCLFDRIEQYWWDQPPLAPSVFGDANYAFTKDEGPYLSNTSSGVYPGKCRWYGNDLYVAEGIRDWDNPSAKKYFGKATVMFGGEYWNGHATSLHALQQLLTKTGVLKTSRLVNSKMTVEGASAMGVHIRMHSTQYTDGRVTGDAQPVTEIIQKVRRDD